LIVNYQQVPSATTRAMDDDLFTAVFFFWRVPPSFPLPIRAWPSYGTVIK